MLEPFLTSELSTALTLRCSCTMQLYPVLNDLMQSMNKASSTPVTWPVNCP